MREGVLVETSALEKAERECAEDADERAAGRARASFQRHPSGGCAFDCVVPADAGDAVMEAGRRFGKSGRVARGFRDADLRAGLVSLFRRRTFTLERMGAFCPPCPCVESDRRLLGRLAGPIL